MKLSDSIMRRITAKIVPVTETGCWLWTAHCSASGYAQFVVGGASFLVHRLLYQHDVGAIPVGLCLDHKCEIKCCVNPAHLEPVTRAENTIRAVRSSFLPQMRKHQRAAREFGVIQRNRKYQALKVQRGWKQSILPTELLEETPVVSRVKHGTYSMYSNAGCRCEPCRKAATQYHQQYRAQKKGAAA